METYWVKDSDRVVPHDVVTINGHEVRRVFLDGAEYFVQRDWRLAVDAPLNRWEGLPRKKVLLDVRGMRRHTWVVSSSVEPPTKVTQVGRPKKQ